MNPTQYPQDDGPISEEYILFLTQYAKSLLPKGRMISNESFFDDSPVSTFESSDQIADTARLLWLVG